MVVGRHLIPSSKHDLAAVERLNAADRSEVVSIVGELLDWTADGNWPVAAPLATFLVSLEELLVPAVQRVLTGNDPSQIYFCLDLIVNKLPDEVVVKLERELQAIASRPARDDLEGNYEIAAEILAKIKR
jgi:hypothetical protein